MALTLHFTKPWIWDQLSQRTQEQAVEWFQDVLNPEIPDNNWIWFQVIVETFLRGLGADWDEALVREHLERHEDWYRTDGWISDGPLCRMGHGDSAGPVDPHGPDLGS